jgi:hypothetical protein
MDIHNLAAPEDPQVFQRAFQRVEDWKAPIEDAIAMRWLAVQNLPTDPSVPQPQAKTLAICRTHPRLEETQSSPSS